MSTHESNDDPRDAEVVGIPPETPDQVQPSATGLVVDADADADADEPA